MLQEIAILRLIHILGGVIWVGGVVTMSFFVVPAMRQAGSAAAGPVMHGLVQRKFFVIMPVLGFVVMLVGVRLMQVAAGGSFTDYWDGAGRWYAYSAVPVIIGFLVGVLVSRPAMLKAQALMAGSDSEQKAPEIQALQAKSAGALRATAWLLLVGTLGMSVARYL